MGQCFLTPNETDGSYQCFPSEGGHAEFAPRNDIEVALLNFLKTKFKQRNRVSVERVVSGTGLVNIYEFLSRQYPELVDAELNAKIDGAGDLKGMFIATNQSNPVCKMTMEIFITAYGAEAGVAALKWLPYGGLYLTGGLTPKNIDLIKDPNGPFLTALQDKGRVSGMICSIPIFAVMVENLGERGAHYMSFKLLQELVKASFALPVVSSPSSSMRAIPPTTPSSSESYFQTTLLIATASTLTAMGAFLLGRALAQRH